MVDDREQNALDGIVYMQVRITLSNIPVYGKYEVIGPREDGGLCGLARISGGDIMGADEVSPDIFFGDGERISLPCK